MYNLLTVLASINFIDVDNGFVYKGSHTPNDTLEFRVNKIGTAIYVPTKNFRGEIMLQDSVNVILVNETFPYFDFGMKTGNVTFSFYDSCDFVLYTNVFDNSCVIKVVSDDYYNDFILFGLKSASYIPPYVTSVSSAVTCFWYINSQSMNLRTEVEAGDGIVSINNNLSENFVSDVWNGSIYGFVSSIDKLHISVERSQSIEEIGFGSIYLNTDTHTILEYCSILVASESEFFYDNIVRNFTLCIPSSVTLSLFYYKTTKLCLTEILGKSSYIYPNDIITTKTVNYIRLENISKFGFVSSHLLMRGMKQVFVYRSVSEIELNKQNIHDGCYWIVSPTSFKLSDDLMSLPVRVETISNISVLIFLNHDFPDEVYKINLSYDESHNFAVSSFSKSIGLYSTVFLNNMNYGQGVLSGDKSQASIPRNCFVSINNIYGANSLVYGTNITFKPYISLITPQSKDALISLDSHTSQTYAEYTVFSTTIDEMMTVFDTPIDYTATDKTRKVIVYLTDIPTSYFVSSVSQFEVEIDSVRTSYNGNAKIVCRSVAFILNNVALIKVDPFHSPSNGTQQFNVVTPIDGTIPLYSKTSQSQRLFNPYFLIFSGLLVSTSFVLIVMTTIYLYSKRKLTQVSNAIDFDYSVSQHDKQTITNDRVNIDAHSESSTISTENSSMDSVNPYYF